MKYSIYQWFVQLFLKYFSGGCHYIGSTDTLPPPLDSEHEEALIAHLSDEDARKTLIEHNLRLVVYIAKRFENTGTGIEDLISIGTLGLIKAINTFRADKSIKLATYASRCIENEILMYIRKISAVKRADFYPSSSSPCRIL